MLKLKNIHRSLIKLGMLLTTCLLAVSSNASEMCSIGMPTIPGYYIPLSAHSQYIYYVAEFDGVEKIMRMNADGSDRVLVWDNPTPAYYDWYNDTQCSQDFPGIRIGKLTVSPDGGTIAFSVGWPAVTRGEEEDNLGLCVWPRSAHIYLIDLTTGGLELLVRGYGPDWSPDSTKLAYHREEPVEEVGGVAYYDIYVMDMYTREEVQLTTVPPGSDPIFGSYNAYPSWSPDGNFIAFVSGGRANIDYGEGSCAPYDVAEAALGNFTQLFVMDSSGNILKQLSCQNEFTDSGYHREHYDHWPTWSPDGKEIAFIRYSGDTNLPHCTENSVVPCDPDLPYRYSRLFKVNIEALETTRLTKSLGRHQYYENESQPSWSADGSFIALTVPRGEYDTDIMLVHPISGEYLKNITEDNFGKDMFPVFWK